MNLDRFTNILGLLLSVSVVVMASPDLFGARASAIATAINAVSIALLGWATGKSPVQRVVGIKITTPFPPPPTIPPQRPSEAQ